MIKIRMYKGLCRTRAVLFIRVVPKAAVKFSITKEARWNAFTIGAWYVSRLATWRCRKQDITNACMNYELTDCYQAQVLLCCNVTNDVTFNIISLLLDCLALL